LAEVNPNKAGNPGVRTLSTKSNGAVNLRYVDTLPESLVGADFRLFAFYTIELRDERGRSAGFSEPAIVSLAPVLPAKGLHSELDSRGVYLIWENETESQLSSLQFDYRIYRREEGHSQRSAIPYLRAIVHTSEGERWSGVDTDIEWNKTYTYWVTPVTRVYSDRGLLLAEIRGEDSLPLEVTTHNVFPPAVPERMMVLVGHVPGKKFVDLTWAPNIEKDLAGYNVYRREADGQMERLNSKPITMLSFQDSDVIAGHRYSYCVSAVDVRGNESAKSPELTEVVR
jgi:fibronectin type 3 domain-containing protein